MSMSSGIERLVGHALIRDWRIGEPDHGLTDELKQDWVVTVHDEGGTLLVSAVTAGSKRLDVFFEIDRGVLRVRAYREEVDEPIAEMQLGADTVIYGTEFDETRF